MSASIIYASDLFLVSDYPNGDVQVSFLYDSDDGLTRGAKWFIAAAAQQVREIVAQTKVTMVDSLLLRRCNLDRAEIHRGITADTQAPASVLDIC